MTDFLITEMTFYPWFTWLVAFFIGMGLWFAAVWAYKVQAAGFAWLGYRRQVWLAKAAVRRQLLEDPLGGCEVCKEREAELIESMIDDGDDPPEYQHDDGDDDPLPEPDEDKVLAFLATVKAMGLLDEDDERPAGWMGNRCTNRDCYKYGEDHAGACDVAPTMPAACYTEGPAMPPQPVREFLHPAIMDDLEQAGFSKHETNEGAVESAWTRVQAKEVQARMRELER